MTSDLHSRVLRGMLATSALRRLENEGQILARIGDEEDQTFLNEYAPYVGSETLQAAKRMTYVYALFFCFENLVRELVSSTMLEHLGSSWWQHVPQKIRSSVEQREKRRQENRWHAADVATDVDGTLFGDLASIMVAHWDFFQDFFPSQDWIRVRLNEMELSRNIIAHANVLPDQEVKRVEQYFMDWLKQVP